MIRYMQGPTKPRGHINFDTSFLLASLQGCLSHLHQKHYILCHYSFVWPKIDIHLVFTFWRIFFPFISIISTSFVNSKCLLYECAK